jgi:hypothetical protein
MFIDAQFFYFLSKNEEDGGGYTKLSVASTDMIESAFQTGGANP